MLCNVAWQALFPSSSVVHLPIPRYDDFGPWLRLNLEGGTRHQCDYFKFLGLWLVHPDFSNQIEQSWWDVSSWGENIACLTSNLKVWNKNVVGNIFNCKHRL